MRVLVIVHGSAGRELRETVARLCGVCQTEGHAITLADLAPVFEATALCDALRNADAALFVADVPERIEHALHALAALPRKERESFPAVGVIACGMRDQTALHDAFTEFVWQMGCDSLGVLDDERGVSVALELISAPFGTDSPF